MCEETLSLFIFFVVTFMNFFPQSYLNWWCFVVVLEWFSAAAAAAVSVHAPAHRRSSVTTTICAPSTPLAPPFLHNCALDRAANQPQISSFTYCVETILSLCFPFTQKHCCFNVILANFWSPKENCGTALPHCFFDSFYCIGVRDTICNLKNIFKHCWLNNKIIPL